MKKTEIYNKASVIFDAWFSGKLPKEVLDNAVSWFLRHRDNPDVVDALRDLWYDKVTRDTAPRDAESMREFEKIKTLLGFPEDYSDDRRRLEEKLGRTKTTTPGRKRLAGHRLLRFAAVLIPTLIVGAVYLWVDWASDSKDRHSVASVSVSAGGYSEKIVLADGSVIILGPGSNASYPPDFISDRSVTLSGEAMFLVAKARDDNNEPRPFTVTTDHLRVSVTGTDFKVTDYSDTAQSSVALFDGNVNVSSRGSASDMSRGEIYTYDSASGRAAVRLMTADEMLAAGYKPLLRFRGATLGQVIRAIEANHNVRFDVPQGTDLETGSYSANYEGETLETILRLFSGISGYDYKLTERADGEEKDTVKMTKK